MTFKRRGNVTLGKRRTHISSPTSLFSLVLLSTTSITSTGPLRLCYRSVAHSISRARDILVARGLVSSPPSSKDWVDVDPVCVVARVARTLHCRVATCLWHVDPSQCISFIPFSLTECGRTTICVSVLHRRPTGLPEIPISPLCVPGDIDRQRERRLLRNSKTKVSPFPFPEGGWSLASLLRPSWRGPLRGPRDE